MRKLTALVAGLLVAGTLTPAARNNFVEHTLYEVIRYSPA